MLLCGHEAYPQCSSTVSTFPYLEDFESGKGGWSDGGTLSDWAWGTPAKPVISGAGSGLKCWITGGLTGSAYNGGERSYVVSPCFDFTGLAVPFFAARIFWETEKQYDGANLQYSTDGGATWQNAGAFADPADCRNSGWFNYTSITNLATLAGVKEGWSGNIQPTSGSCLGGLGSNGWITVKHMMPYLAGVQQVLFRFTFGSGTTCNAYDGFAFDSVVVSESPPVPLPGIQVTPSGCNPPSGTVTVSVTGPPPPYAYSWSPNVSSTAQASQLATGTYTVTVTDASGCTASATAVVTQTPAVSLVVTPFPDTCSTSRGLVLSVPSDGTPPFGFLWSDGSSGQDLSHAASGTYTLTVTDAAGCTAEAEADVGDTGSFVFDLGPDLVICGHDPHVLTPAVAGSVLWQDGTTTDPYILTAPGLYSAVVTSPEGCTATDSVTVTESCLDDVLLPAAFSPNGDGFNDLFSAYGTAVSSFTLQVMNRWGAVVFSGTDLLQGWDGRFRGRDCPAGIYAWRVVFRTGNSESRTRRGTVLLIR